MADSLPTYGAIEVVPPYPSTSKSEHSVETECPITVSTVALTIPKDEEEPKCRLPIVPSTPPSNDLVASAVVVHAPGCTSEDIKMEDVKADDERKDDENLKPAMPQKLGNDKSPRRRRGRRGRGKYNKVGERYRDNVRREWVWAHHRGWFEACVQYRPGHERKHFRNVKIGIVEKGRIGRRQRSSRSGTPEGRGDRRDDNRRSYWDNGDRSNSGHLQGNAGCR